MKYRPKVFTKGPAGAVEGGHAKPLSVFGVPVVEVLLVRVELRAALVRLADDRFAITGAVAAAGNGHDVTAYARRHALYSSAEDERAWFRACMVRLLDVHRAPVSPAGHKHGASA